MELIMQNGDSAALRSMTTKSSSCRRALASTQHWTNGEILRAAFSPGTTPCHLQTGMPIMRFESLEDHETKTGRPMRWMAYPVGTTTEAFITKIGATMDESTHKCKHIATGGIVPRLRTRLRCETRRHYTDPILRYQVRHR